MSPEDTAAVLALFEKTEDFESLMWRVTTSDTGEANVRLFAQCSDFFYWATADCEEITPDDLPLLRQTLADLQAVGCEYNLAELFAARKRRLRPQKPAYKHLEAAVHPLFDACCTEGERQAADKKDAAFWLSVAHRKDGNGK